VVAVFLLPLLWMISGALKSPSELAQPAQTLLPKVAHPETFEQAWTRLQIAHFLLNTAFYAIGGWLTQIIIDVAQAPMRLILVSAVGTSTRP